MSQHNQNEACCCEVKHIYLLCTKTNNKNPKF